MNKKYYNIEKHSLANSLNWLGLEMYVWTNKEGKTLYGFENTEEFHKVFHELLKLRSRLNIKN